MRSVNVAIILAALSLLISVPLISVNAQGLLQRFFVQHQLKEIHLNFAGTDRTYYIYDPTDHNQKKLYPLVIGLHGTLGTGPNFALQSHFNKLAKQNDFIVVYPDAGDKQWNDGRFPDDKTDDAGFIAAMIDQLVDSAPVNPKRIYITGVSNGGMFTQMLACQLADRVAAFASVIGNLPALLVPQCHPSQPVPMMLINADHDAIVPYDGGTIPILGSSQYGGGTVISVPDTITFWLKNNGCTMPPHSVTTALNDVDPEDDSTVVTNRFSGCPEDGEVLTYTIINGGHAWPGMERPRHRKKDVVINQDIHTEDEIWAFFSRHQL